MSDTNKQPKIKVQLDGSRDPVYIYDKNKISVAECAKILGIKRQYIYELFDKYSDDTTKGIEFFRDRDRYFTMLRAVKAYHRKRTKQLQKKNLDEFDSSGTGATYVEFNTGNYDEDYE